MNKTSLVVFSLGLVVVGITLVAIIFPALYPSLTYNLESEINPFEPGPWAILIILTNPMIMVIGILYFKKLLPYPFQNRIHKIRNFEISAKLSTIIFSILIISYVILTIDQIFIPEKDEWLDFIRVERVLENYPNVDYDSHLSYYHVTNFLTYISQEIFENVRIIPYITSVGLVFLTYFFTVKISNSRFAGIVATLVLLQSFTFQRYDAAASYPNFWTFFLLLSLFLTFNKGYFSPFAFLLSIFSKPLSIVFLPATIFFILNQKMKKKKRIFLTSAYLIFFIIIVILLFTNVGVLGTGIKGFDFDEFLNGFGAFSYQLRSDGFILVFLVPVIVGLFLVSKRVTPLANSIILLIIISISAGPLLAGFTGFNIFPYRFMPLVVFFSVAVGLLFSRKFNQQV